MSTLSRAIEIATAANKGQTDKSGAHSIYLSIYKEIGKKDVLLRQI